VPALDLLKRTGVRQVQVRYSDDEDPVIWMVAACWYADKHGMPVATKRESEGTMWKTAAGFAPSQALFSLLDALVGEHSGGACTHCRRLTGFDPRLHPRAQLEDEKCWWTFNGEEFVRGCK
jgi:hypothetical protein